MFGADRVDAAPAAAAPAASGDGKAAATAPAAAGGAGAGAAGSTGLVRRLGAAKSVRVAGQTARSAVRFNAFSRHTAFPGMDVVVDRMRSVAALRAAAGAGGIAAQAVVAVALRPIAARVAGATGLLALTLGSIHLGTAAAGDPVAEGVVIAAILAAAGSIAAQLAQLCLSAASVGPSMAVVFNATLGVGGALEAAEAATAAAAGGGGGGGSGSGSGGGGGVGGGTATMIAMAAAADSAGGTTPGGDGKGKGGSVAPASEAGARAALRIAAGTAALHACVAAAAAILFVAVVADMGRDGRPAGASDNGGGLAIVWYVCVAIAAALAALAKGASNALLLLLARQADAVNAALGSADFAASKEATAAMHEAAELMLLSARVVEGGHAPASSPLLHVWAAAAAAAGAGVAAAACIGHVTSAQAHGLAAGVAAAGVMAAWAALPVAAANGRLACVSDRLRSRCAAALGAYSSSAVSLVPVPARARGAGRAGAHDAGGAPVAALFSVANTAAVLASGTTDGLDTVEEGAGAACAPELVPAMTKLSLLLSTSGGGGGGGGVGAGAGMQVQVPVLGAALRRRGVLLALAASLAWAALVWRVGGAAAVAAAP